MRIRPAGADDAARIAALHAASWRSAYRGILSDAYLDGPILADRDAFWRGRLSAPPRDLVVSLADQGGDLVGVACLVPGQSARWGTLIDNLHIRPDLRGRGHGRELLSHATRRLPDGYGTLALHLTVFAANTAAQGAYDAWGGAVAERLEELQPDGHRYPVLRYAWPSPAALLSRLANRLSA